MFVFYEWPFPRVYFAKNVANIIFPLNYWLFFQWLVSSFMGMFSLLARLYASNERGIYYIPVTLCLSVFVCHNRYTRRANFWHRCFLRPIPHNRDHFIRKFRYLQKQRYFSPSRTLFKTFDLQVTNYDLVDHKCNESCNLVSIVTNGPEPFIYHNYN